MTGYANEIDRDRLIQVKQIPLRILNPVLIEMSDWIANYNQIDSKELISWNGRYHHCGHPMATIFTDACEWQKGVFVHASKTHPQICKAIPMDRQDATQHITHQEQDGTNDGVIETVLERNLHDGTAFAIQQS